MISRRVSRSFSIAPAVVFVDQEMLDELGGRLDARLAVSGPRNDLAFDGPLTLMDGVADMPPLGVPWEDIRLVAHGESRELVIDSARVEAGGGSMGVEGSVVFGDAIELDLLMGFDGVGVGNADFFSGSDAGRSFFNPVGNTLTFGGVATTGLFNIPAGASVRISGAMTLIGDPASIEIIDFPVELFPPDVTVGMGESSNVDKFVPECVRRGGWGTKRAFVMACFEGDGGPRQGPDGFSIHYSTYSDRLARELQELLAEFGVIAARRSYARASGSIEHRLTISGMLNVRAFADRIGFLSTKQVKLKELITQLDTTQFAQVHRSVVVNLRSVAHVTRNLNETAEIHLKGREEVLPVSRSYLQVFRQM